MRAVHGEPWAEAGAEGEGQAPTRKDTKARWLGEPGKPVDRRARGSATLPYLPHHARP